MKTSPRLAIVGNPNCGKTTLFNALTGARQHIGNWPGVTVERKTGHFHNDGIEFELTDLPGIYSLTSVEHTGAVDQCIACEFMLSEPPDIIINIVDATHLERSLYLTSQLMEIGLPMLIVVNMLDIANKQSLKVDLDKLSQELNCPVIGTCSLHHKDVLSLKKSLVTLLDAPTPTNGIAQYPEAILNAQDIVKKIIEHHHPTYAPHAHWLALRLLEGDCHAQHKLCEEVTTAGESWEKELIAMLGQDTDVTIAEARFQRVHAIASKIIHQQKKPKHQITERLDKIFLHRYLGIPIFLGVMYCLFVFAINIGGAFQDFFDISSNAIFVDGAAHLLSQWHSPNWLIAIVAAGLGKGINTIVTFIPVLQRPCTG